MVREPTVWRVAVVCTAFSMALLAAGPAHAGVGDLVDDAVGGAGGGAVSDAVPDAVEEPVGEVADSADAVLRDVVRKVTRPARPSPQEGSPGARGDATGSGQAAAEPQRGPSRDADSTQHDSSTPAAGTSPDASSNALPQRLRASALGAPRHRPLAAERGARQMAAERGARQMAAALAPHADHPCASGSLAVRDLRRCARAGASLPGLGGAPMMLLPAGLAMVGLGLLLVARGRRRDLVAGPAT